MKLMFWYNIVVIYKRHLVKALPFTRLFNFTKKCNMFNFSFNSIVFSKNTFQNFLILFNNYLQKYTKNWLQWTNSRKTRFQFLHAMNNQITCAAKLTLVLSLGVKVMWSSVSLCKSLHPGANLRIPKSHSYRLIKCCQLISWLLYLRKRNNEKLNRRKKKTLCGII